MMKHKAKQQKPSIRTQMILFNSGITLAALLLCGLVFVVCIWFIMEKEVRRELEFFMTETNENLNSKTGYLESVIYNLRESDELIQYLEQEGSKQPLESMRSRFIELVKINNQSNYVKGGLPMAEQIYLFDQKGNYCPTYYYAMVYSEEEESNRDMEVVYRQFLKDVKETDTNYGYYLGSNGEVFLAYPLYNYRMESLATIIFRMKKETLEVLMEDLKNYPDSFWVLYDSTGQIITSQSLYTDSLPDEIFNENGFDSYEDRLNGQHYLIQNRQLSMNLKSCIAIPTNQITRLLYDSVKIYLGLILFITLGAVVCFILIMYRLTNPLKEISDRLHRVKTGNFETKLPDYSSREFQEISQVFNETTAFVNHLINQVYEKQISIKDMELKFYQTQMNPHFMFNVLNTIGLQAKMEGNEEVFQMITSFSQLIQAKIYRADKEKVRIKQELEYVKYYLYLQKNRYGNRLTYEIDVTEKELDELYIPKLCIQLIVENAVVHGIEPKTGKGFVRVCVYRQGENITIDTIDNGIGFEMEGEITLPLTGLKEEKGHNHVGLNNAHHIIQLMYGREYGIRIFSQKGEGATVRICIPQDTEELDQR